VDGTPGLAAAYALSESRESPPTTASAATDRLPIELLSSLDGINFMLHRLDGGVQHHHVLGRPVPRVACSAH
jgi:hypothetical protein